MNDEWVTPLVLCGYSLKRETPSDPRHLKEVEKAINLLDTFYFDVSPIRGQFEGLMADEAPCFVVNQH